ncbi:hypothetical protein ACFQ7A_14545 [Streptomyces sp. NPDC056528]|uniref:hypothetical protein n=1 Tax=Streptomyces sp. NPDC056528 TaxID=3345854 RepID=UPI003687DD83
MNLLAPLPTRSAGALRKAAETGTTLWLDHRHTSPSAPLPHTGGETDENVRGLLLPGGPALPVDAGPAAILAAAAGDRTARMGPVHSVTGYRQVMGRVLTALETAVAEGAPPPPRPLAIEYSLPGADATADARLDLAGDWEAKAMRGRAGLAGAHLVYTALRHDLTTDRWARLAASGARAPYLLWTTTGPSVTVDHSVRYAERCLFPGTVLALSPAALREFDERGVVTGPTAPDAVGARRVAETLAWFGVRLDADAG